MSNLNLTTIINDLQSNGIACHVHHSRPKHTKMVPVTIYDLHGNPIKGLFAKDKMFKEHGGKTVVTLTKVIDGNSVSVTEESICHRKDRFQKSNGTKIAITRAIETLSQINSLPE